MIARNIESVCVFGSTARNSTDCLSDRDVLIVCDDSSRRNQIRGSWRRNGWSVATYSPSRLLKMIAAKSLFIQHLKDEGIIVEDRGSWLQDKLSEAQKKHSYEMDANLSVLLALPIERFNSESLIGETLLAADLAYVATRNFGICYLANKEKSVFDYDEIVECLRIEFELSLAETRILKFLRPAKTAYREKIDCLPQSGTIDDLRRVLSKFFVHRPLSRIDTCMPTRWLGGGYSTLRDLEALIVTRLGRLPTNIELENNRLQTVWKWINNPRAYSWQIRNSEIEQFKLFCKERQPKVRIWQGFTVESAQVEDRKLLSSLGEMNTS